jgi:hypothetical protein
MRFSEWMSTQPLSVPQHTRYLMQVAYNAGLEAAARTAEQERAANEGSDVVARSGDQAAAAIAARLRAFRDKEATL